MGHRRGISLLEVILVKLVLLGTAVLMRGAVRDATASTMARANEAILETNIDDGASGTPPAGGLPGRAAFIGNLAEDFHRVSPRTSHPLMPQNEKSLTIRDRNTFCGM